MATKKPIKKLAPKKTTPKKPVMKKPLPKKLVKKPAAKKAIVKKPLPKKAPPPPPKKKVVAKPSFAKAAKLPTKERLAEPVVESTGDYRKQRKYTVPKLTPFLTAEMTAKIRTRLRSKLTGPLTANELVRYLGTIETDRPWVPAPTPDGKPRRRGRPAKGTKAAPKPVAAVADPKSVLAAATKGQLLLPKVTNGAAIRKPAFAIAKPSFATN